MTLSANSLQLLHANPELAVEMERNARKKAEQDYNSELYYRKLIPVYESVSIINQAEQVFAEYQRS